MPFYKTKTFFICLFVLIVLVALSFKVLPKASAKSPGSKIPLVELALAPDQHTKDHLSDSLAWDFGLIPIYVVNFSLLCFIVGRLTNAPMRLTWSIILVVVVASLFDVAENFALLHVIKTSQRDAWASAARALEYLKWISPLTGGLYPIALVVWRLVNAARR